MKQASNIRKISRKRIRHLNIRMGVCSGSGFVRRDLHLLEQRSRELRGGTRKQPSLVFPWQSRAHKKKPAEFFSSTLPCWLITSGGQPRAVKCITVCSWWGVGRSQNQRPFSYLLLLLGPIPELTHELVLSPFGHQLHRNPIAATISGGELKTTKRGSTETKGVPIILLWLSRLTIQLVSMRMQVWSPASLNELRIWHCHELCCRSQMQLRSDFACSSE